MASEREPIAVIGTGYVGLVTAAGFAELGSEVWCVDVDADKIERLQRGEIPIYEPGLADSVARNRKRMHFSTELSGALEHARLLFVAVGTPPTYSGDADLSSVNAVVASMPPSNGHALVMKSTVPVGTGTAIKRLLSAQNKNFAYVSCPEFLKEGSALEDFLKPDRVVIGDDGNWAGDAVAELYAPLDAPLVRTDIASAEMVKLAANAFLATKISFINEIANVCEETGADVLEVARGMGLDQRIGKHFLKPGIGFGGSCFAPEGTVLARHRGRTTLLTLERLWERLASEHEEREDGLIEPSSLEVLSWVPGGEEPQFLPVMCVTRRDYEGELINVRTKTGRGVRCTPDHGWIVGDGRGGEPAFKLAADVTTRDWVPLAMGQGEEWQGTKAASLLAAAEAAELSPTQLIVRPARRHIDALVARPVADRRVAFAGARSAGARTGDVRRTRALRLDGLFWRVVGLYLADGHASLDDTGRRRIFWSFRPTREQHLADEVVAYWLAQNVQTGVHRFPATQQVDVSSRLVGTWWTEVLGLGRGSSEQRLPDLIWEQADAARWALLSGLFEADGSWSQVNGGPNIVIELGTISGELADGVLRLLASVGVVASKRTGRTAKSAQDTHWIRIGGAHQVERAIALVPERDRPGVLASIARRRNRIAPTGHRRFGDGPAWLRVTSTVREPYRGPVYSLEVPYAHTVIATDGLVVPQCFPKDVSALKQLAGNSGYHFQLLTAVIEVNELQKRRVIGKLQKHLGSLVGTKIAMLGLAFKPNTDDMREASSLVLSARLQADGAQVRAYDPVAENEARKMMTGVEFADSAMEALDGADACIIVTEWPEFGELDWAQLCERMAGRLVVDGRNFLDPEAVRGAGFIYEGIGR
jgi:UDPglucose 6-dehydrogenase